MGHYTPREHLRRFACADAPEHIHMFDKNLKRFSHKPLHVNAVAKEKAFYPDEVEKDLAANIEDPGNICARKLMAHQTLSDTERHQFATYLVTMSTRGPRPRRKNQERANRLFPETVAKARDWINAQDAPQATKDLAMQDLLAIEGNQTTPEIEALIKTPFKSKLTVSTLVEMAWIIVSAGESMYFVTSDHPATYFEGLGLGNPECEFTMSLSKDFAIVCHHYHSLGETDFRLNEHKQIIKEINRRLIAAADRFIFSPRSDDWISKIAMKENPYLSRIRW